MMVRFVSVFSMCLAGWPVMAQSASLGGPVSGVIFDSPTGSIRPVIGIPGSSYLGQAIIGNLDNAFVAPDGSSALAAQGGQNVFILGLRTGNTTTFSVPDLCSPVDRVSWAANSKSFVAWCSSARLLQRWTVGPPAGLAFSLDLSSLPGDMTGIVTSPDGTATVLGMRDGTQGGFYAVADGGAPLELVATADPGAAIFDSTGGVLYAIDRQAGQVLQFSSGIYGPGAPLSFAGESSPLSDPVGAALSRDGRQLYVAGGSDQVVRQYDINSLQLLAQIPLDAAPNALSPLSGTANVFLLSTQRKSGQPIWLLDARTTPLISFIPAGSLSVARVSRERTTR